MTTIVTDPCLEHELRAAREAADADRYDEVWDGSYMMTPLPNFEHQDIGTGLATIFRLCIDWPGLGKVVQTFNVSDRDDGWEHNYRAPDVAVTLTGGAARNCGTHYVGGPDFLVEIVSPHDLSRDKLSFYSKIGVRELLLIDRYPWALELFELQDDNLTVAGRSTVEQPDLLASNVLPLSFRLLPGDERPTIEVVHRDGIQRWTV